jgi:hypothetical protein
MTMRAHDLKRYRGRLALVALILPASAWAVDRQTPVQDNGLTCRPGPMQYGSFSRDFYGIKNTSSSTLRVFCPLTPPSYDSISTRAADIARLSILYTSPFGVAAPSCVEYTMSKGGAAEWSNAGELSPFFGGTSIYFAAQFVNSQQAVSIGYVCDVPPQVEINGSFYYGSINEDDGGV